MNIRPAKPRPVTRRRIYKTAAGLFGIGILWGVITVDEADQLLDLTDRALGLGASLLALANVNPDDE